MSDDLPSLRLRPKVDARRIRHGFPWVYANEAVTDRRTKALSPGSLAVLEDGERRPLALVGVNPTSKLIGRVLDRDPGAEIDETWFAGRIARSLALRAQYYETPFYRLVHAEGDGLPGVVIDRFGDAAVVQPNAAWAERRFDSLVAALVRETGVRTVVKNATGRARALEGLDAESGVVAGGLSGSVPVPMNGAVYMADLTGGQKTGLFYDQRENHAFVSRLARGTRVLDVFSHVGGFSLAALAGGASEALAVDASRAALDLAEAGAEASGVRDRFATRRSDAFDAMAGLADAGETFGTVICDPPAFAPSREALEVGLRAYEKTARLAARLVSPGGTLTLCSCSHAADLARFAAASLRGIGRAGRRAQILRTGFAGPDHPQHPDLAETGYLKAMTLRLDG